MKHPYFQTVEGLPKQSCLSLPEVMSELVFNEQGLIPVITQDHETKTVLMMAWANKAALEKTLETGRMTYWSRSRSEFWVKGDTSGHTQELVSMSFDCDGDAVLCLVKQQGAACHTGRPNCFYLKVDALNKQVHITASMT